ncbi:hypothetical protein [Metabacillus lacus]|uniref:hypothetical protein n=1 Tax=Metabacillus lacus TaxID=1983721 RepID=UPI0014795159|nr:hypothetical protein [Metabacillus lacus]
MRYSAKGEQSQTSSMDVFGMDLHDFIAKEQRSDSYELASEFGLSLRDVKNLKKHMNRS